MAALVDHGSTLPGPVRAGRGQRPFAQSPAVPPEGVMAALVEHGATVPGPVRALVE